MRKALVLLVSAAFLAGCADKSTEPSPISTTLTGTWAGPITFEGTQAQMSWTLLQADATVSGRVLVSLPSGTVLLNGFLTGTVAGSSLNYLISVGPGNVPSRPDCVGQLAGNMTINFAATNSSLVGPLTVTSSSCPLAFPGAALTLTRQ